MTRAIEKACIFYRIDLQGGQGECAAPRLFLKDSRGTILPVFQQNGRRPGQRMCVAPDEIEAAKCADAVLAAMGLPPQPPQKPRQ